MSTAALPQGEAGGLVIALVAGEESGDALGAPLMRALREALSPRPVSFVGVGGRAMQAEGLASLFPMGDIAVMGFAAVIARLPLLLRRIKEAASAIVAAKPDALVIIDSPDFTHRVARRVRARLPKLPLIDYVSPSVWAWRPGRARAMRRYVDHVLALLPFEPAAHRRLDGPDCSYVGHPLSQRLGELTPSDEDLAVREASPPVILVLPGSRRTEVRRLMPVFGATIAELQMQRPIEVVLPAVSWLADEIAKLSRPWPLRPTIVTGEAEKLRAFRRARVALAASGTVALELALAQVPMVGAYQIGVIEFAILKRLATVGVGYILLPNLILDRLAIPELYQANCNPGALAAALAPLFDDTSQRRAQLTALDEVRARIAVPGEKTPAALAAEVVLRVLDQRRWASGV
jgi:lipid-A-disaccharide synthase